MKNKTDKKEICPNGLYHAHPPEYKAVMVDPNYNGFRVTYFKMPPNAKYGEGPYGIMDAIPQIKSMADGKMYDSKSQYYAALKASDSHVIESGEHNPETQAKLRGDFGCRNELKQAIQEHLH